jgi:hypothetical protein
MRDATERANATQTGTPIAMRGIICALADILGSKRPGWSIRAWEIERHARGRAGMLDSHGAGNRVMVQ